MFLEQKAAAELTEQEIDCLYYTYLKEMQHQRGIPRYSRAAFEEFLRERVASCRVTELTDCGRVVALLIYETGESPSGAWLDVPVYGYHYVAIRDLSVLFGQVLRDNVRRTTTVTFSAYAHDTAAHRYLMLTRFGACMEYCVRKLSRIAGVNRTCTVSALTKAEIAEHWEEIWALLDLMLTHLKDSPVFYFGDEFSEESYREFFMEEELTVFAARDGDGRIVGLIESNAEKEDFLLNRRPAYNISEAVVYEPYRRTGVAEALLACCERDLKKRNIPYSWVNHGTVNPNAMGFWDKYFTPYRLDFERTIEY